MVGTAPAPDTLVNVADSVNLVEDNCYWCSNIGEDIGLSFTLL